jgi:hypothetical protein
MPIPPSIQHVVRSEIGRLAVARSLQSDPGNQHLHLGEDVDLKDAATRGVHNLYQSTKIAFIEAHDEILAKLNSKENGTCTVVWGLTFTALNESGNEIVASIPDYSPEFERAIEGLEHFLETGEIMTKSSVEKV